MVHRTRIELVFTPWKGVVLTDRRTVHKTCKFLRNNYYNIFYCSTLTHNVKLFSNNPTSCKVNILLILAEGGGVEPHPLSQNLVFKASRRTIPAASPSKYINKNPEPFGSRGLGLATCSSYAIPDPWLLSHAPVAKRYSGCMVHPWILGFSDEDMRCCTTTPSWLITGMI